LSALDSQVLDLEARIDKKFEGMSEQMRDIETAMLRAFHGYAQGVSAQIQKLNGSEAAAEIRLPALESRVLELETRRRN
jgi:acyl-homoserine lactone acylase PvdQ